MLKLSLTISFILVISINQILCEDSSSELNSKLVDDYKSLNRDLVQRLIQLEQQNGDSNEEESDEIIQAEKRFPRWGGGVKSLHDLKNNRVHFYEQKDEKRYPKWRNSELKSRLSQPQKFEPYFGDRNYPMRKIWEKNFLEKNKIYEKNNLI